MGCLMQHMLVPHSTVDMPLCLWVWMALLMNGRDTRRAIGIELSHFLLLTYRQIWFAKACELLDFSARGWLALEKQEWIPLYIYMLTNQSTNQYWNGQMMYANCDKFDIYNLNIEHGEFL